MEIRNTYHKNEEDGLSGRPEGVALLVRFLSIYSFLEKERSLNPTTHSSGDRRLEL